MLEVVAGSQIVVDGEVLDGHGLEVDESLLSGEADPVAKASGAKVLSGSFVAAGAGRYRATAVGREAYAARIAEDARRFTLTHSELRAGIDRILVYVTWAIIPTAILLFISQLRSHDTWQGAMSGAVAGTVAMVPEGLVLLTSLAFAVAVRRLAQRRVLVQELPAVEGLARVDVLCIDKTGTLTRGALSVEEAGDARPRRVGRRDGRDRAGRHGTRRRRSQRHDACDRRSLRGGAVGMGRGRCRAVLVGAEVERDIVRRPGRLDPGRAGCPPGVGDRR